MSYSFARQDFTSGANQLLRCKQLIQRWKKAIRFKPFGNSESRCPYKRNLDVTNEVTQHHQMFQSKFGTNYFQLWKYYHQKNHYRLVWQDSAADCMQLWFPWFDVLRNQEFFQSPDMIKCETIHWGMNNYIFKQIHQQQLFIIEYDKLVYYISMSLMP